MEIPLFARCKYNYYCIAKKNKKIKEFGTDLPSAVVYATEHKLTKIYLRFFITNNEEITQYDEVIDISEAIQICTIYYNYDFCFNINPKLMEEEWYGYNEQQQI